MNFNNFNLDNLKKIIEIMFDVARSAYRSFEMKKKIVRIMVDASYSNVYGLSPNFFGLIVTSLTESSMLNLCLVYDNHKDAFGIKNILKLTRHLVDTGTSISDLTREDISNDLKKTSELESLGVLKELRNKKFGHASYQAILHEEYMPKPASISFGNQLYLSTKLDNFSTGVGSSSNCLPKAAIRLDCSSASSI